MLSNTDDTTGSHRIAELSPEYLHTVVSTMTSQLTETITREVGHVRREQGEHNRALHARIGELKSQFAEQAKTASQHGSDIAQLRIGQAELGERVGGCESRVDAHALDLVRLDERTRNVSPTLGLSLSKRQKAALWSAGSALALALLELARQGAIALLAYWGHS